MKNRKLRIIFIFLAMVFFAQRHYPVSAFLRMSEPGCMERCCLIGLFPFIPLLAGLSDDTTKKVSVNGTPVPFEKQSLEFYPNGTLKKGWLENDAYLKVNLRRLHFGHGKMTFHSNGNIRCGYLYDTERLPVGGRMITFKGRICFRTNGNVRFGCLAKQTSFKIKSRTIALKPLEVVFDRNGELTKIYLTNSVSDMGTGVEEYLKGR